MTGAPGRAAAVFATIMIQIKHAVMVRHNGPFEVLVRPRDDGVADSRFLVLDVGQFDDLNIGEV